jgi:glycosyltransferase involved in cell wall biosynthesis
MRFSIIIPTFNNLEYLKLCLHSLKKNSKFDHEVIVHNNGNEEPTNSYLVSNNVLFTYSRENIGITGGVNTGARKASTNYIVYAHDDFYFLPGWDIEWANEIKNINGNKFYLSGTMVQDGQVNFYCGDSIENFDEKKLLENNHKIKYHDFQGSTWAPHVIHKDLWHKVRGFSEEFFPGTGSDPDLNLKLWNQGVRIFKGIGKCKVYHFGSIVTRKKFKNDKSVITDSGRKGAKTFLKKWGFSIKFFTKHYLRGCKTNKCKLIICNKYDGPLQEPNKNLFYFFDLLIDKLKILIMKK